MYTVGLESDTRVYFIGVIILISLPTGTKIFNWLFTYLGNPPLLHLRISSIFFSHLPYVIGGGGRVFQCGGGGGPREFGVGILLFWS